MLRARVMRVARVAAVLATAATGFATAPSQAADAQAGKAKAAACSVCHGPQGLSVAPETPNLAGQPAGYLAAQLQHFRSGARKHEVMQVIAKPLSDDDIANLAAWFSSQEVALKAN